MHLQIEYFANSCEDLIDKYLSTLSNIIIQKKIWLEGKYPLSCEEFIELMLGALKHLFSTPKMLTDDVNDYIRIAFNRPTSMQEFKDWYTVASSEWTCIKKDMDDNSLNAPRVKAIIELFEKAVRIFSMMWHFPIVIFL